MQVARYITIGAAVAGAAVLYGCGGRPSLQTPATAAVQPASFARSAQSRSSSCAKRACLYVGNENSVLTIFDAKATGNATPLATISGADTGLDDIWGVAVDASRNVYVANYNGGFGNLGDVTVYAAGAYGDAAPVQTITNQPSGNQNMHNPSDITLDASGNIYVSAQSTNSVSVYPPGADGGIPPASYISGKKTHMSGASNVAVAADGTIYVANWVGKSVTAYAAGANGNAAPIATIRGKRTQLLQVSGIALDAQGNIYVTSNANQPDGASIVTVYAAGADGDVAPIREIEGANTKLNGPNAIAVDGAGNVYVTEYFTNSVTVYAAGASGDVAPVRTIAGANTLLAKPTGLVVH